MSWIQPICKPCWVFANPGRIPVTMRPVWPQETCCACGDSTNAGLFIHVDPSTVMFPKADT